MNAFIFQSTYERYPLVEHLVPGQEDCWYATRYRDDMNVGKLVFFWQAGPDSLRGLYGWGHLLSSPFKNKDWNRYGVNVRYEVKFRQPVLASKISKVSILHQMLIFRAPQATNFILEQDELSELVRLLDSEGEQTPNVDGGYNV